MESFLFLVLGSMALIYRGEAKAFSFSFYIKSTKTAFLPTNGQNQGIKPCFSGPKILVFHFGQLVDRKVVLVYRI
jgi:hypothetical protein